MDHFKGLNLDLNGSRYRENELLLVHHLMEAGLLRGPPHHDPPVCQEHGNALMLYPCQPWKWSCGTRKCSYKLSVITPECFLNGKSKFYSVFKALYLWANGHSLKVIVKESGLEHDTVTKLTVEWRSVIDDASVMIDGQLGHETKLVEADETAISGKRKYNVGRYHTAEG